MTEIEEHFQTLKKPVGADHLPNPFVITTDSVSVSAIMPQTDLAIVIQGTTPTVAH